MTGHIAHIVGLVLDHLMTTPNYFQLHYPCLLGPQANQRVSHRRVLLPTSELMRPAEARPMESQPVYLPSACEPLPSVCTPFEAPVRFARDLAV